MKRIAKDNSNPLLFPRRGLFYTSLQSKKPDGTHLYYKKA